MTLSGLAANTTYHYRVTSVDASANSSTSATGTFQVTVVDTTPPTVTLVRPTGGERIFAGTPYVVQWTASDAVGVTSVDVSFSSNARRVLHSDRRLHRPAGHARRRAPGRRRAPPRPRAASA